MKVLIAVAAVLAFCWVVDSAEHDLYTETSLSSHHHGAFRGDYHHLSKRSYHHLSKRSAEARVVTNPEYYNGGYDGLPKYRYYGIHHPGFRSKRSAEADPGHHRYDDFPRHRHYHSSHYFGFRGKRSADPEANPSHFYGGRGLYRHSGVKHGVYTPYGNFS